MLLDYETLPISITVTVEKIPLQPPLCYSFFMEIERKYLLTEKQLSRLIPNKNDFILETRYYLYCKNDTEIRFTKRGAEGFTLDRMEVLHDDTEEYFIRRKQRITLTEDEFKTLVSAVGTQKSVQRLHFKLNEQIELKVYQGRHDGLIRAEVEFDSIEEANNYTPTFEHSGEITNTPIGRDVLLAHLNEDEMKQLPTFRS